MTTFTGTLPDGTHLLVDVWPDGSAQAAVRGERHETWSPPVDLDRAPLVTEVAG